LRINKQPFEVEIIDEPLYSVSSTDNIRKYSKEYLLGEDFSNAPRFGIVVKNSDGVESSCFVLGNSIGVKPHDNSAVVVGENLFISIGNLVCCFEIPSLTLQWQRQVDTATSFSVYVSPDKKGIISHGELEITKVSFDGQILWSASGKDIFTEGFTIFPDHIEVVDFNHERYNISLSDGQISLQQNGG
jgi:hypothetical protein